MKNEENWAESFKMFIETLYIKNERIANVSMKIWKNLWDLNIITDIVIIVIIMSYFLYKFKNDLFTKCANFDLKFIKLSIQLSILIIEINDIRF